MFVRRRRRFTTKQTCGFLFVLREPVDERVVRAVVVVVDVVAAAADVVVADVKDVVVAPAFAGDFRRAAVGANFAGLIVAGAQNLESNVFTAQNV